MSNSVVTDCWIQTFTGKRFTPLEPDPADICIEDIGHALSNLCRFNGHCSRFYSVAEHSIWVSELLPDYQKKWGLLHDAAEAYLADLTTPVKAKLAHVWHEIEERLQLAITRKFGLSWPMPTGVKDVDTAMLFAERDRLFNVAIPWCVENPGTVDTTYIDVVGMLPQLAEEMFLMEWRELNQTWRGWVPRMYD